jgi:hypothetical protein
MLTFLLCLLVFIAGAIALVVALIWIDYLFTKSSMQTLPRLKREDVTTTGDGPKVLLIFMTGVLARSKDQLPGIIDALLSGVGDARLSIVRVDHIGERENWRTMCDATVSYVDMIMRQQDFDEVIFVGLSKGGRYLNAVYHQIIGMDWFDEVRRPIIVDAPPDHRGMGGGGNWIAPVLRFIPIGRVVNSLNLVDRFMRVLPQNKNIDNAADFAAISGGVATTYPGYIKWVRAQAMTGLSGHKASVFRDQVVNIATMPWYEDSFKNRVPLYIACTNKPTQWKTFDEPMDPEVTDAEGNLPVQWPKNDTIRQWPALSGFRKRVAKLEVWVVRSTHCGFYERPRVWSQAIEQAVKAVRRS